MNSKPSTPRLARGLGLFFVVALSPALHVWAAGETGANRAMVDAQYQADRAACMTREDVDSRKACLREAGAARQEALRGTLGEGASTDKAQWERNALLRCQVHTDLVDRSACERMVMGKGESAGSVEGGGVIRQITTTLPPVEAAPAAPAR